MAQSMLVESSLRLVYETGLNEKGEPIYKGKTYNNVKKEATVDQLFQVAQAIGTLSTDPIHAVERNDRSDITA
ncbi:DUF1659 domain-containing protein [Bacillus sp. CGMCC 1.16607]|uniref:DUF1659 domain-containing protein n=1 Tax=Bacillus sp. CGMCC 1.16607 TaxID=3351842 RepID=UPI00362774B3